jgi:hypothetical protein
MTAGASRGSAREGKERFLQRIKGLVAAVLVATPLAVFMAFWLHATREFAAVIGLVIGLAIFVVVATRSDSHDEAADAAWRAAALDLPPASDRVILERLQASMPGPDRKRKAAPGKTAPGGQSDTPDGGGQPG